MARALGQDDIELGHLLELPTHIREPFLADARGERVDDQRDVHRLAYPRIPSSRSAVNRSASSSVSAPGLSQVNAQFAADSASSAAVASSRSVRSSPSSRPSRKSARNR